MAERRPLLEGLKKPETDRSREEEFVFQHRIGTVVESPMKSNRTVPRVPLSTRIRADIAEALKRASLERQLQKLEPNTVQDIMETALEPWLKTHGHL